MQPFGEELIHRGAISPNAAKRVPSGLPVVLLVVICGLLIAAFVTTFSKYYIIVGTVTLVLSFALVRNLQVGLLMYLFIAALAFGESPAIQSPNSEYKAGLMPSEVLLAFLAALWIGRAVLTGGFKLVKSELNLPLVALAVVSFASLVVNNVMIGTREVFFHQMLLTQVAEVGLLGLSICAFFLSANAFKDRKWIARIFVPVVLLGCYDAAHHILGFEYPIQMVWGKFLLAAAIALIYARLLFDELEPSKAVGFGLLLVVLLYGAYKDLSWVSGWIAAAGVVLTISYYRSKALAVILIVLVIVALFVYPGIYHSVHQESYMGGDFDRFIIWQDAFRMFAAVNPFLGIGPGNYYPYVYYYSTIWFGKRTYTTAHSNYVQMASELGLVGLAVFLWVIVSAIRTGNNAVQKSPPDMRWLGIAATAIFSAIAVASIFGDYLFPSRGNNGIINFGTTVYTWLILGAAVAASNLGDSD